MQHCNATPASGRSGNTEVEVPQSEPMHWQAADWVRSKCCRHNQSWIIRGYQQVVHEGIMHSLEVHCKQSLLVCAGRVRIFRSWMSMGQVLAVVAVEPQAGVWICLQHLVHCQLLDQPHVGVRVPIWLRGSSHVGNQSWA